MQKRNENYSDGPLRQKNGFLNNRSQKCFSRPNLGKTHGPYGVHQCQFWPLWQMFDLVRL